MFLIDAYLRILRDLRAAKKPAGPADHADFGVFSVFGGSLFVSASIGAYWRFPFFAAQSRRASRVPPAARLAAPLLLAAFAGGCLPLVDEDFERDPLAAGWTVVPPRSARRGPTLAWTDSGARSGSHALTSVDGAWRSPRFRVDPFAYYRLRVASKADGPALCAMEFDDADGRPLDLDWREIEASADWIENALFIRAPVDAASARARFQPVGRKRLSIDDVAVDTEGRDAVLDAADALYASMPPLTVAPPPERWALLAKTMDRLRSGGPFRIVMLGDESVRDVANSPLDVLIERLYPRVRLEIVASVRPDSGCWYFQHGIRVKNFILEYQPDLLVIGGNGHQEDVESIRSVIQQVRAKSACEILVMSGAMGPPDEGDPRARPDWAPDPDPEGDAYRDRLMRMAREEKAECFDFEGAWGRYIQDCGKPYGYFLRDDLHANTRGRQALARILERYFAPAPSRQ
jgi:hypothetical protein